MPWVATGTAFAEGIRHLCRPQQTQDQVKKRATSLQGIYSWGDKASVDYHRVCGLINVEDLELYRRRLMSSGARCSGITANIGRQSSVVSASSSPCLAGTGREWTNNYHVKRGAGMYSSTEKCSKRMVQSRTYINTSVFEKDGRSSLSELNVTERVSV